MKIVIRNSGLKIDDPNLAECPCCKNFLFKENVCKDSLLTVYISCIHCLDPNFQPVSDFCDYCHMKVNHIIIEQEAKEREFREKVRTNQLSGPERIKIQKTIDEGRKWQETLQREKQKIELEQDQIRVQRKEEFLKKTPQIKPPINQNNMVTGNCRLCNDNIFIQHGTNGICENCSIRKIENKLYLDVSYAQKDIAKERFQAKWDPKERKWWIEGQINLNLIPIEWLPTGFLTSDMSESNRSSLSTKYLKF